MRSHYVMINFLGWAALTYAWLTVNITFVNAIAEAIDCHNVDIRSNGYIDGYNDCMNKKPPADS